MSSNPWLPLTLPDLPDFVACLRKYPLSMDDSILRFPLQTYALRLDADDAEYFHIPGVAYLAIDPITPHDAVVHFIRDPTSRAKKRFYLDTAKSFMVWVFERYSLNRLTLIVVEGSYHGLVPMETYANHLGFKFEGTMRQSRMINERAYDIHIFGILRTETLSWESL